jgi:hypothetical protein
MYYNRVLTGDFAKLLENGRELRWLFDFVLQHEELDFQIGKSSSKEWISVYYGLTRLFSIRKLKNSAIFIDTAATYQKISKNLYGKKSISDNFQDAIEGLIVQIENESKFDRYYKNEKEGYYQNIFSRRFGICGKPDDEFVIIDKEAVVGYKDQKEKDGMLGNIQKKYKQLQLEISNQDSKRFGKDLQKKSIGNELDFLALDKQGNILLIEFKHGTNTSGIYLSPLQIGLYYDIFTELPRNELESAVSEMLVQKQKIGLINPLWHNPESIKEIIPVLVVSNFNERSAAKANFQGVLGIIKEKIDDSFLNNLQVFNLSFENRIVKLVKYAL